MKMKRPTVLKICVDEDYPSLCETYEDISMEI